MDKFVSSAKELTKSIVPNKILDSLWARYLTATSKEELSVAASIVASPAKLKEIQRHYAASNNERDFLTFEWLRRRVADVQDPALKSYFAIDADDITPALGAPADCYRALIDSVIAVSVQSNLQVGYMLKGERVIISNYAQLLRDLLSKQHSELRFISHEREFAFHIEKWRTEDETLLAPRANPITRKIYLQSPSAQEFLQTPGKSLNELYPMPMLEEATFDVDVVYTWVNASDPDWQKMHAEYADPLPDVVEVDTEEPDVGAGDAISDRFISRDELKYSLRSLLKYAPWVQTVYIVTNCKPPQWFDESNERVKWVYHEEIIEAENLPTFSSHAIEASIHRVPDLSEHFLYFNDDLFLLKPVKKSDFFLPNGLAKTRPEPYGMVHGELDVNDPDYVNAARNVQALLQSKFGKTATRLHTHSPQSMRLSVVQQSEATFPEAYQQTRSNRFRSITDISPSSFMYPNFAYVTGNAVMDFPETALVTVGKQFRKMLAAYVEAMEIADYDELPLTLCINDGGGSTQNPVWGTAIVGFMESQFDEICEAEKVF